MMIQQQLPPKKPLLLLKHIRIPPRILLSFEDSLLTLHVIPGEKKCATAPEERSHYFYSVLKASTRAVLPAVFSSFILMTLPGHPATTALAS